MVEEQAVQATRYDVGATSRLSARALIDCFGDGAVVLVRRRVQALLHRGDEEGATAWIDIAFAMDEVRRPQQADEPLS